MAVRGRDAVSATLPQHEAVMQTDSLRASDLNQIRNCRTSGRAITLILGLNQICLKDRDDCLEGGG